MTPTYPGVYIEEISSGVRTITGVATSITAFVGRAWKGPLDLPTKIYSFAHYERVFGGLWAASMMSYAVQQFFANGGSQALIVRVATRTGAGNATAAAFTLTGMVLKAASEGSWGMNLKITVDDNTKTNNPADPNLFNLLVVDDSTAKNDSGQRGGSGAREMFRNVSIDPNSPRFVQTILDQQSNLIRFVSGNAPTQVTDRYPDPNSAADGVSTTSVNAATAEIEGSGAKTGIYALEKTGLFNLLCIPPLTIATGAGQLPTIEADVPLSTWTKAANLCKDRRAVLLLDAPSDWTVANVDTGALPYSQISGNVKRENTALYFPRLRMPDALQENNLSDFAPCGAVAGIISRTDAERGVWKSPAGIDASLQGVLGLSISGTEGTINDSEQGALNPLGINCIRNFSSIGHVVWGARTVAGSDVLASEWKYIPVRRTALFIEESLFRGTQWVVFEPNDEPLWAQIRLNVGAFMHDLFRKGAFQGQTPKDAYFVKCDKETTTQNDIDHGIVNILVGFAPLKPAEFVVIKLQQMAGQIET